MTLEATRVDHGTPWAAGRFDAKQGPQKILFGRMYEDAAIEERAFAPGGRILCIASAGCTAMKLATRHDVVAVDINAVQLEYAARRIAGAPMIRGSAERMMSIGRSLAVLAGWTRSRLCEFLELDDPARQMDFWRAHLDTRRFRWMCDGLLSSRMLRRAYAPPFLAFMPQEFGAILRSRLERCFARHSNRTNPYARALLLGESSDVPPSRAAQRVRLVHADVADFLEREPASSFDGFTLSNVLDGVDAQYEKRLMLAVKRAAAPNAKVVIRSFKEPERESRTNLAADDRSILWGIVAVRSAADWSRAIAAEPESRS
jgi:S-adenosylmethionine:diacylglycerol 3-amino-3-carboxypropyl transferase